MTESERLHDPLDHRLHGVAVYNPDLLSEAELKQLFIARHGLLDRFVEDLHIDRPAHKLLLGSRGMGKSTFLRRLRFAIQDDSELSKKWLPLVFPEEQYNVTRLSDFYLNCLDAITDALEHTARSQLIDELDRLTEELAAQEDNVIATSAKDVFREMSQRIGQGFVLLVDNAERILDELSEAEEWDLRSLLSEEDWLVFVGASAQGLESSYEYGKPFYDFFDIKELKGLNADDTEKVLRSLAATTGHSQVVEWIERDHGRLKTLNVLSGGNPRTVVLLFQLLVQGIDGDVRSDLERLLDMCTPLYKARFEELPQQAQQVMDAVALLWEPSTAADVATQARMEVTKVSSQLNRLVRQGTIEKVDLPTTKKTGYQIAERFFNIWYLMRSSRRVRRKLLWLVQFLKVFYSQDELLDRAKKYLNYRPNRHAVERDAEYGFSLAQALESTDYKKAVEYSTLQRLVDQRQTREKLAEYFDFSSDDHALKDVADRMKHLQETKEKAHKACRELSPGIDANEFTFLLVGAPILSVSDKRMIAESVTQKTLQQTAAALKQGFEALVTTVRDRALMQQVYKAFGGGYIESYEDLPGAEAAANALAAPQLAAFLHANAAANNKGGYSLPLIEASIDQSPSPWIVDGLASAYIGRSRFREAETAYWKAIKVDPTFADPWNGLGNLLTGHLRRYEEAEAAYRKAIEIDPTSAYPWHNLGNLLKNHLRQYEEAERAYRKAIELDPANAICVHGLAYFLFQYGRDKLDEAESLAHRAVVVQNSVNFNHTLACILVAAKKWFEAVVPARRFLMNSNEDWTATNWNDVIIFFRESLIQGFGEDALHLLIDCGREQEWRPLTEALRAAVGESKDLLRRQPLEIQAPAQEIYDQLVALDEKQ